jgi:hypothetical protein
LRPGRRFGFEYGANCSLPCSVTLLLLLAALGAIWLSRLLDHWS